MRCRLNPESRNNLIRYCLFGQFSPFPGISCMKITIILTILAINQSIVSKKMDGTIRNGQSFLANYPGHLWIIDDFWSTQTVQFHPRPTTLAAKVSPQPKIFKLLLDWLTGVLIIFIAVKILFRKPRIEWCYMDNTFGLNPDHLMNNVSILAS